ncbi:hypothetical protein [Saccharolobus shibatae]|nr:hypothetical protein [Saccharolobus shibatae]
MAGGNMVEKGTEAKSSSESVTHPYRRTEHCDKIHAYRHYMLCL